MVDERIVGHKPASLDFAGAAALPLPRSPHGSSCSIVEALAPQGKLGIIHNPKTLDATLLKRKSLSLHWEFMFTRSAFETPDMMRQHQILERAASLIDEKVLQTTWPSTLDPSTPRIFAERMPWWRATMRAGRLY